MNVKSMGASRELDFMVADRVLGKLILDYAPDILPPATVLTDDAFNEYLDKANLGVRPGEVHPQDAVKVCIGRYSQSLRWAEDVMDHMHGKGYICDTRSRTGVAYCRFTNKEQGIQTDWFKAEKLPEAICKAALAATLKEEEISQDA